KRCMFRIFVARWDKRFRPSLAPEGMWPNVVRRCSFGGPDNSENAGPCECRVPRATFRSVKAISSGIGMSESRVHNMRVRKAKDQFPHRDSRKQSSFTEQTIVRRALKLE